VACYHPIPAYQHGPGTAVRLWPPLGEETLNLPCGACLGCRTDRATDWARRAEHEATFYKNNCFLTLTYSDENLPRNGELQPKDLRDFIKRLRRARDRGVRALASDSGSSVRYLACGEYGEQFGRPHYHLLLFNCGFSDAYPVAKGLMESPALAKLWSHGLHKIGELTGASASYVAQYTMKKHGTTFCTPDGEILRPPFLRVSLKPALGTKWLTKYKNDLSHGYLVTDGVKGRVPRAYKQKLLQTDAPLAEHVSFKASQHIRPRVNLVAAEAIHKRRAELSDSAKKGRAALHR
jgi:hypothetical protein